MIKRLTALVVLTAVLVPSLGSAALAIEEIPLQVDVVLNPEVTSVPQLTEPLSSVDITSLTSTALEEAVQSPIQTSTPAASNQTMFDHIPENCGVPPTQECVGTLVQEVDAEITAWELWLGEVNLWANSAVALAVWFLTVDVPALANEAIPNNILCNGSPCLDWWSTEPAGRGERAFGLFLGSAMLLMFLMQECPLFN